MVVVSSHSKNASIPIFIVNGWTAGDTIAVADLTPPHNQFLPVYQAPGVAAWAWAYEDKQYGYAYFQVDEFGSGKLFYQFTNGKIFDGDTFTAACVLSNEDRVPMYAEAVQRGVNARSEGWVEVSIVRDAAWWSSVKFITFYFGRYQKQDDQENWNVVIEVVRKVFEAISGGTEPAPAPETTNGANFGAGVASKPHIKYFEEGGKQMP